MRSVLVDGRRHGLTIQFLMPNFASSHSQQTRNTELNYR